MFSKNLNQIVNASSIYIDIARSLSIIFESKLIDSLLTNELDQKEIKQKADTQFDTLVHVNKIEKSLRQTNIFSSSSFFNLKNKAIRKYIFTTYSDITALEKAMDDINPGNRQFMIAKILDERFIKEVYNKKIVSNYETISNYELRKAMNLIFGDKFQYNSILKNVDKIIDEADDLEELNESMENIFSTTSIKLVDDSQVCLELDKPIFETLSKSINSNPEDRKIKLSSKIDNLKKQLEKMEKKLGKLNDVSKISESDEKPPSEEMI